MIKSQHKIRLIKFGLPIAIILAIIVGVFSFPDVGGNYSPYTSLAVIYYFDNWSMVNVAGYVAMFALAQFFLISFVLSILILRFTHHKNQKQWWSALFSIISMSVFLFTVLLFVIWISSGLFTTYLQNSFDGVSTNAWSVIIDNAISYVLPSLILVFSIVALIFWLAYFLPTLRLPTTRQKFNYNVFDKSTIPWMGKDKQLKTMCWIGLSVAIFEIVLTSISIYYGNSSTEIFPTIWGKIWFGTMHHFTELSNLWVAIFFLIFLINYKVKILKTSAFVTMTFTYISVTFLIADFLLAPFMILNHSSGYINMGFGGQSHWWDWIKTALFHVVQPVVVLFFFIFFCKSKRAYRPWKFTTIIPITMIFPLLYLSYAIAINYMPIAHLAITSVGAQPILIHGGVSVYGYFTCINPNVHANIFDSDNKPDWTGKPANGIWYAVVIMLFLCLAFYYNWIERHTMAMKYLTNSKQKHKNYRLNKTILLH